MTLGPIAFLSPWLLAGLLALPVIWWLLRTVPPRPQRLLHMQRQPVDSCAHIYRRRRQPDCIG